MPKNKYGVAPKHQRTADGITFDSKREMERYCDLRLLEKAGEISALKTQVDFVCHVGGRAIGKYYADFVYTENGEQIVEDVKGVRTSLYQWKKKHVEAEYGVKIREI